MHMEATTRVRYWVNSTDECETVLEEMDPIVIFDPDDELCPILINGKGYGYESIKEVLDIFHDIERRMAHAKKEAA